jgi:hypothetical protein
VRVGRLLQGERRADFDAQLAGVEVPGRLLQDRSLALPVSEKHEVKVLPPTVSWTTSAPSVPVQARSFAATSSRV